MYESARNNLIGFKMGEEIHFVNGLNPLRGNGWLVWAEIGNELG